ncbi:hypothetical protein LZ016_05205 [Sphingomonas sp. SM33]|uniref:Uncharacterized protein n=1 Tax=Sphingomonas telluris TaxID=2907998 RepID=A0ABS9VKK1_9SPHN|nr:hypothetical protein [Sphingomonas telluris]MCH8615496.1 hypothetical protein [Sphingomonas telluris]
MTGSEAQRCTVVGAEKLPAEAGDARTLCEKIEAAVAAQAPNSHYTAQITVVSKSILAADVSVGGRQLPVRKLGVTDRDLNAGSISRFANAIAEDVAKATKS